MPEGAVDVEVPAVEGAGAEGPAESPAESGVEGSAEPDGDAEVPAPTEVVEPVEVEPAEEPGVPEVTTVAPRTPRKRRFLRRRFAVAGVVLVGALAVSAFARVGPSAADTDQHFVDGARAQGHVIAAGSQEAELVSAAHKICDRRQNHSTEAERHATALSSDDLTVIQQAFGSDTRGFTVLALNTYCS